MGLQKRASLYGGLGLLFLVAILVFIGVWAVAETTERSLNERVAIAQMVARSVDQSLLTARDDLEKLAIIINLEDESTRHEFSALSNLYSFSGVFSHVFLVDSRGQAITSYPMPISEDVQSVIHADPGILEAIDTGASTITSSVAMDPLDDTLMFSVATPVYGSDGTIVGAVAGHIELTQILGGYISPLGLGSTAYMEVVSGDGQVMASSKETTAKFPEETEYAAHFASLIEHGEATMETCFRCHDTGRGVTRTRDVLAFAPLSSVSGGVAIRQSEAEALAPSSRLLRAMLLAGSPLFILGMLFTWLSTRTIVRPVIQLTAAARRITEGDLDAPITTERKDELGQLAQAFDSMRLGLKESLAQKEDRASESENRARHLAVLNAIASTVSRSLDLEQILKDSLEQILRFLVIESGGIYLAEGDPPQLRLKTSYDLPDDSLGLINQLSQEPAMAQGVASYEKTTAGKTVTLVRVPLISKEQSLGDIWLVAHGYRQFSPEEFDLLTSIGHQVGVAVDNARLFQESRQRESEAQTLQQLGIQISRLLDLDRILTTVVDSALRLQQADGAILALYDENAREIYIRATSGSLAPEFNDLRLKPGEESILGTALGLGTTVSTRDYLNDPAVSHGLVMDNLFRKSNLRSCLLVPLKIGEQVSGVLMVVYHRETSFAARDIERQEQLANQAAVALETSRLYNQVQELAIVEERARLSREMHDSLGQALGYLGLEVDGIGLLLDSGKQEQVIQRLAEIRKVLRDTSIEMREHILALRTPVSLEVELPSMLKGYLEAFQQQTGIKVALDIRSDRAIRFSTRAALQIVRVIQEALSNVRKHARASQVDIKFEEVSGQAVISVTDNGIGFEPAKLSASGQNFGLQVMKERMASLAGSLEITSSPGKGTEIIIKLALEAGNGNYSGTTESPVG